LRQEKHIFTFSLFHFVDKLFGKAPEFISQFTRKTEVFAKRLGAVNILLPDSGQSV